MENRLATPNVTEVEIRKFLNLYSGAGNWLKADRRTHEGRAQSLALARGWIELFAVGFGYRITAAGAKQSVIV
jgi:hypothetical protein